MKTSLPTRRPSSANGERVQRRIREARSGESGYALLLVLFLAATIFIAMSVGVPSVLTEGRRQKEGELIWRGEQYDRAIGLYFRKTGHFPTSMEELTKGLNGVHFLRKAYKDPMNAGDGTWRLIYVTPGGQLIGSIRYLTLVQYQASLLPGAGPLGALTQPGAATPAGLAANATAGANPPSGATSGSTSEQTQPQPTEQLSPLGREQGKVFGGSLIGVASKIDKPSIKVFHGGHKYREWEFIWNPMANAQIAVTPGATPITGAPGQPGQSVGKPVPTPNPNPINPPPNPLR